jgi:glucose/arabinose dehydrogenase
MFSHRFGVVPMQSFARSFLCLVGLSVVMVGAGAARSEEKGKPAAAKPAAAVKPAEKPKAPPAKSAAKPTPGKPTPPEPTFECRWADGPITLDGKAEEPAWSKAPVIDRFVTPWPKEGPIPATQATRARLLWDGQYLYFFADMDDHDLFADITEHDGQTWLNDVFEIFLKPAFDKTGYYEFEISPAGTKFDIFIPERNAQKYEEIVKKEIFTWETAIVRRGTLNERGDRDEGWSVEGRIPWIDLIACGGRPVADEAWQFALCRGNYEQKKLELTTIAPLTLPDFHQHEAYPRIRFVGPTETTKPYGLTERVPLTTSKVVGSPDPPLPFRPVRAYPELELSCLIMARHEPGTNRMLALTQPNQGKPVTLIRFVDDPAVKEFETLHEFNGTAYDFTFHPQFAENGYLYVGWNGEIGDLPEERSCRISRLTLSRKEPFALDPQSEVRIIEWVSNGHDGASIVFGNDGMLYVTTGDGSSDSDTYLSGQDMTRLLAKVLRLDVDHVRPEDAAAGRRYSVPPDNPFVGKPNIRPETWCYGFRNPWRMANDPRTGHIWVTQNGQDLYEQVYLIRPSENYGWSVMEGSQPFYLERERGPTPIVPPTVEHPHSEARSLTGGIVYYGTKHPSLRGAYVYGDHSTGKIWMVRHDGKRVVESREIADTTFAITGFGTDSHGELLVYDYRPKGESAAYYLEAVPPQTEPSTFPRRLSESGLFVAGAGHRTMPGVVPYTVNSPLWSDGTYKERFFAVPGEDKITPSGRAWTFPEGAVLIKSFALETEAGKPESRRWIETRFMTKQQNEWIGYSYQWNDEQTDAELVESKGADRTFTIRDAAAPGGARTQTWHYPSRAECMICHSRAANFVLGVSTAQLNCEHDYGGTRDNQLRALAHSGLLTNPPSTDWRSLTIQTLREAGFNGPRATAYWNDLAALKNQRKQTPRPTVDVDAPLFDKLVDPADRTAPLEARARSYLHANCAHCHVHAGGGNAQIQLGQFNSLFETKTLGERPLHASFGLPDPRIIAPGHPERSTLVYRVGLEGRGRMPPIAVSVVDRLGVELLSEWVASMPEVRQPTHVDP